MAERFINRDISWLSFNSRVLDEACDKGNPLLERLKFLAIFSSNLDEFFMVRMAGLFRQPQTAVRKLYKEFSYVPGQLMGDLESRIRSLLRAQYKCFNSVLLPELEKAGILIAGWNDLNKAEKAEASDIFRHEIFHALTPVGIDPVQEFPTLPNLGLELLVRLEKPGDSRKYYAVLEVPQVIPRFVPLTPDSRGRQKFVLAEELIAHNLDTLFNGWKIKDSTVFRITRDMEFSLDEESVDDLLTRMQIALQKKTKRVVVRLEIEAGAGADVRRFLRTRLNTRPHQEYSIRGPLNLKALFELLHLQPHNMDLHDSPMPPLPSLRFPENLPMFDLIREQGEGLIHLPYESFDPVIRFLEEAAEDPDVLAIKQTLYRVSSNSRVLNALTRAARNGKQVTVLCEIRARFDEENNIRRAQRLADAGAHVLYGMPDLKVHAKMLLVVRRENNKLHRYVHLGSGNYNDSTARQYTDLGFFTDDPGIADDVAALFNVITGFSDPPGWNKLIVAPFDLKKRIISMIDREASLSTAQRPGSITVKVNAVIDYETIEHLYRAASKGVKINMFVRGICGMDPFALPPEISKNIRVVSILDRFLEHSRIYIFGNGGKPEYYAGSADMMPRNFKRRVEVLFPVTKPELRAELDMIMNTVLNDRRKGRVLKGANKYSVTWKGAIRYEAERAQVALYEFYKKRLES